MAENQQVARLVSVECPHRRHRAAIRTRVNHATVLRGASHRGATTSAGSMTELTRAMRRPSNVRQRSYSELSDTFYEGTPTGAFRTSSAPNTSIAQLRERGQGVRRLRGVPAGRGTASKPRTSTTTRAWPMPALGVGQTVFDNQTAILRSTARDRATADGCNALSRRPKRCRSWPTAAAAIVPRRAPGSTTCNTASATGMACA